MATSAHIDAHIAAAGRAAYDSPRNFEFRPLNLARAGQLRWA